MQIYTELTQKAAGERPGPDHLAGKRYPRRDHSGYETVPGGQGPRQGRRTYLLLGSSQQQKFAGKAKKELKFFELGFSDFGPTLR